MSTVLLSYGGGKDSTALVVIDQHRDSAAAYLGVDRSVLDAAFPPFAFAVFADPGAEFGVTYQTAAWQVTPIESSSEPLWGQKLFSVIVIAALVGAGLYWWLS